MSKKISFVFPIRRLGELSPQNNPDFLELKDLKKICRFIKEKDYKTIYSYLRNELSDISLCYFRGLRIDFNKETGFLLDVGYSSNPSYQGSCMEYHLSACQNPSSDSKLITKSNLSEFYDFLNSFGVNGYDNALKSNHFYGYASQGLILDDVQGTVNKTIQDFASKLRGEAESKLKKLSVV